MSGGQQAQLAPDPGAGRQPRLLVLDEPMAMPRTRWPGTTFMATVMTAMADDGVSVVLSSQRADRASSGWPTYPRLDVAGQDPGGPVRSTTCSPATVC